MFNLFNQTDGVFVLDIDGDRKVFESGKEAADYGKLLSDANGCRYSPRPAPVGDKNWRERELARFESGQYKVVEVFKRRGLQPIKDHFVHVSTDDNLLLAYTKNEEKGLGDVQTKASVTGYLETFYPSLRRKEIEEIVDEHEMDFFKGEVLFATTPDEIEHVYTNVNVSENSAVVNSCMRSLGAYFTDNTHPTRVYGSGDLAIAYIKDGEGYVTDRALVWPEKKIYSRVYGTNKLHILLKKLGYQKSRYYDDTYPSFEGAKLLKIPTKNNPESKVILPYIDERYPQIKVMDDHLVFSSDDPQIAPQITTGAGYIQPFNMCRKCGQTYRQDHMMRIGAKVNTTEEDLNNYGHFQYHNWCNSCTSVGHESIYHCDGFSMYVLKSEFDEPLTFWYDLSYSYKFSAAYIDGRGKNTYQRCAFDPTIVVEIRNGIKVINENGVTELWSLKCIDDNTWVCGRTGLRYSNKVPSVKVLVNFNIRASYQKWTAEYAEQNASLYTLPDGRELLASNAYIERVASKQVEAPTLEQSIYDLSQTLEAA